MKYKILPGALFLFFITIISIPAQIRPHIPVIKAGILNKKAVLLPDPVVPSSIDIAASGPVTVEVLVDMEGKVVSAKAISGQPLLRKPAEEAALKARFTVALIDGPPVKVSGFLVYGFSSFHFAGPIRPNVVTVRMISNEWLGKGPLFLKKPIYPPAARAVNASGRVEVSITCDKSGKVIYAKVLSGHLMLRGAALAAAKRSRFRPVAISGRPAKFYGVIVYNFING